MYFRPIVLFARFFVLLALLWLTACGGGGGGNGGSGGTTTPPATPQNLAAVANDLQVDLNWDVVTNADSYNVYWHDNGTTTSDWTLLQSVATTSFIHTGLSSNVTYSYRITATTNSLEGEPSAEVNVTTPPATPQNLAAVGNGLQVDLNWDAVTNADSYNVYWHDNGTTTSDWTLLQQVATTSLIHTGLSNNVTYSYRITATTKSLEGKPSAEVNVITPPATSQNLTAVANGLQVDLSWDAVTQADSYNIYWHDNGATTSDWTLLQTVATNSFSHTGLTSYITYSYRVSATTNSLEGDTSAEVSATTAPPTSPQNPLAIANGLQVNLSWNAVANADSYNIYWHDNGATTNTWTLLQSVITTSASHPGLSGGITYSYRITAITNSQESKPSATVSTTTHPATPQNPAAVANGLQVNLSWNAVANADSYNIYWHDNGATISDWTLLQTVTTTSASHTGLSRNITYSYRITATTNSLEGAPSAQVNATTLPASPQNPAAAANGLQVDLSWDAVTQADSYNIYWHDNGATISDWTLLQTVATNSFSHTGLSSYTTYSYRISATSNSLEGDPSAEVSATTAPPTSPQNPLAIANGLQVNLSWNAVANADSYNIYWHDNGATISDWTLLQTVTTTSASHTGLSSNVTYSYRITATTNSLEGDPSAEVNATTLPPTPQNPAAAANGLQVNLSWDVVAQADSYNIYWHDNGATISDWTLLQTVATNSFSHTSLTSYTTYSYRISATTNSQEGSPSTEVSATTAPPAAPQNPAAITNGLQVDISWNAVTNADSYNIYWHDNGATIGDWTLLQTVNTNSFSHTSLSNNVTYSYRITAIISAQEGDLSAEVSATTAPSAPQNPIASVNGMQIDLSWDAVASTDSYSIYWHDNGATVSDWTLLQSVTTTSFSHTNLSGGISYSYRISATANSQESNPSVTVSATTPPAAPQNLASIVAANGSQVDLSWDVVTNAGSYNIYWHDNGATISDWTLLQTVNTNSFSHTGLGNGITYSYRVSAIISQEGEMSAPASATTPPSSPQNPAATAIGSQVDLTWDAVSNADGYNIYWHDNGATTSDWTLLQSVVTTRFSHNGLSNGVTYNYRISATTQGVVGMPSAISSASIFSLINQGLSSPSVMAIANAIDGSGDVYVAGSFSGHNGSASNSIIRFNSDGTVDTDFNVGTGFDGAGVRSLVAARDDSGDIYVGGYFQNYNDTASNRIIRLNSDGSVDTDFNVGTGFDQSVYSMAIDAASGDLYVGGYFQNYNGTASSRIIRLNSNGSIDTGFNVGTGFDYQVNALALATDGSGDIYVAGDLDTYNGSANRNHIIRLNSNGTIDSAFAVGTGFNGSVTSLVMASDGSGDLYVGGSFTKYQGADNHYIIRLNSNGTADTNFSTGTGFDRDVYTLASSTDGSGDIYATSQSFSSYNGTIISQIVRLNNDGTVDTSFDVGTSFDYGVYAIAPTTDGSGNIYMGGGFSSYNGTPSSGIIRLAADGAVTKAFSQNVAFDQGVQVIEPVNDSGNDLYVGGRFTHYNGLTSNRIIRLNSDSTLDSGFDTGTGFDDRVNSIARAIDGSGDIYVGGAFTSYNGSASGRIIRLNSDGTIDTSFDVGTGFSNASVETLALAADSSGDIYVGGGFTSSNNSEYNGSATYGIIRLNSDGTIDTSFDVGTGFNYGPKVIVPARDGSGDIYVGGNFTSYNGTPINRIIRLNSDGSMDTAFNVGTGFNGSPETLVYPSSSSGEFYVGGQFTSYNGTASNHIIRLNSNGSIDTSFNVGTGFNSTVNSITVDAFSSDIHVGGQFTSYKGSVSNHIIRLNRGGGIVDTADTGFNNSVSTLTLSANGEKLYVGGYFTSYQNTTVLRIVAINQDGSID